MHSKKKILIVTSGFPLWATEGLNVFMLEIAQSFAKNFEVYVLAPYSKRSVKYEKIREITVYRHHQFPLINAEIAYRSGIVGNLKKNPLLIFFLPFFFLLQLLAIRKIVKKHNIDIINAHWIIPQGVTAGIYKMLFNRKIKILCTIMGSDYLTLNNRLGNFMKKIALDTADATSAASEAIRAKLISTGYKKPVYYYPMGVASEKFSPDKKNLQIKDIHNIKKNFILYVGGLIEGKGIRPLVQAMNTIVDKHPDTSLVLIGEGYLLEEMKSLAESLGIKENIIFTGVIPNQDLPPYFATADVFILPSYSEGYPGVVRESLSSGTITVVTDLSAYNAIPGFEHIAIKVKVKNSEDISEKIVQILDHPEKYSELKIRGREFILRTSDWNTFAENYKNIFNTL